MHSLIWFDSRYLSRLTSTLDQQNYYSKISGASTREDVDPDLYTSYFPYIEMQM